MGWKLEFTDGPPERALLEAASGADLLVIGTREHRGVRRLLYGSVSHRCLSRSVCPVVAVSPSARPSLPQRRVDVRGGEDLIVVGVDGSRESRKALKWAFAEAQQRRTHLLVVACSNAAVESEAPRDTVARGEDHGRVAWTRQMLAAMVDNVGAAFPM